MEHERSEVTWKSLRKKWQHRGFSPSRFDAVCDFHVDGCKLLIVANDSSHMRRSTPSEVMACALVQNALSDAPFDGEIEAASLLLLVQPWIHGGPLPADRIVLIKDAPFDARQIFDFCMAVIRTEVIGWRVVKGKSPAHSMFMAGTDWVGAVASMDSGTGPQLLP